MNQKIKADVLVALAWKLGQAQDDLARANLASRFHPVDRAYDGEGLTLGEIIAHYEREKTRWNAAIAAVEVL